MKINVSKNGYLRVAAFLTVMALGLAGAANAGLIIVANGNSGGVQATAETALDGGLGFPCTACATNPVTTFGYTSGAELEALDAGTYIFTFAGAGDTADANIFTLLGHTFTANPTGATGAGSTSAGTSFAVSLTAGEVIPFTFTNATTSCSITDGAAPAPAGCADYLIALTNSPTSAGALGPQASAWIGFSDSPSPDHDYQDLVVSVTETPEPGSLALLSAAVLAFIAFRAGRHRSAAPQAS